MPRSIYKSVTLPGVDIVDVYVDQDKVEQAERLIKAMPSIEREAYNRACINFGNMLARYIRNCIKTSTPPKGVSWQPLSENYIKNYDVKGFWYLSGQMLRSIKLRYYQNGYYVGPNPGEKAADPKNRRGKVRKSKLTLIQLANLLERGTFSGAGVVFNELPPRPLFRPSFNAVGGTDRLKKYLVSNLRREINKYK